MGDTDIIPTCSEMTFAGDSVEQTVVKIENISF